jgi:hypothetical protein
MDDRIETLLRDTFDRTAQHAPPATGLAAAARTRLRRRRRAGAAAAAVATVAAAGAVAWSVPRSSVAPPAPGVVVVPEPAPRPSSVLCAAGASCEAEQVAQPLRRPLALPEVAGREACPVSASRTLPAAGGFSGDVTAVGDGPFRLTGSGTVEIQPSEVPRSGWEGTGVGGQKVIWWIDASYSGPVLLRGARIDGPGDLGFDRYLGALGTAPADGTPTPELVYPETETDGLSFVRTFPSSVRLREPGCYAVQADGTSFSEVIVFRAVPAGHQATP